MGLGRYEGFRPQKIVSNVTHDAGAMCYIRSTKKMRRCDPEAQPSAVRDHQPGEPTPRTSGSSRPCPWCRVNRDSLHTALKQVFTPPLVTVKHMIIPARGAGFGPEPPQGPRGVAPCPGFSAAHCRGAWNPRYHVLVDSIKVPILASKAEGSPLPRPVPLFACLVYRVPAV